MQTLTVSICSRDAIALGDYLQHENTIEITHLTSKPDDIDGSDIDVLIADPDLAVHLVDRAPNLRWLQSTWAGNAPLLTCENRGYQLTVAGGIFDKQIREYVFAYLLAHARRISDMNNCIPPEQDWQNVMPSYLYGKTLGTLGTGKLAKALLPVCNVFGMTVIGLSRSGKHVQGYGRVYAMDDKTQFAAQADFVVNLMPDTPDTRLFLDADFFNAMRSHGVLINEGRGSAIDETALLAALESDKLDRAVLDVFNVEPLPENHPFWQHPKITVTHHTAAITQIKDVAALFVDNAQRFLNNEPLLHVLDWERGY